MEAARLWDDVLGETAPTGTTRPNISNRFPRRHESAGKGLSGLQLSDADKEKLARNRSFASWSAEGVELARTVAYQKPDGSGILARRAQAGRAVPRTAPEAGAR